MRGGQKPGPTLLPLCPCDTLQSLCPSSGWTGRTVLLSDRLHFRAQRRIAGGFIWDSVPCLGVNVPRPSEQPSGACWPGQEVVLTEKGITQSSTPLLLGEKHLEKQKWKGASSGLQGGQLWSGRSLSVILGRASSSDSGCRGSGPHTCGSPQNFF